MHIYKRKMKTVCKKNLEVFDFKDEAEVPELALRIKSKLENPKNAIDKYAFLATAAAGKDISADEINYVPSLGIAAINSDHIATTLVEKDSSAKMMPDSDDAFMVAEQHPQSSPELRTDLSGSEVSASGRAVVNAPVGAEVTEAPASASPSNNKLNSAILDFLPSLPGLLSSDDLCSKPTFCLKSSRKVNWLQDEAVEMDPHENGSMCQRSSSSDVAEDDGDLAGPSSDHCIGGWEMDNADITIVFSPDYVVYCGSYYTDSVISFTSSSIKMEGSAADGDDKTFKCKWGIEDILHIRSHWYEQVEMAMVKIHVLTKDTVQTENVECTSGTELKFAVIGSSWYGKLEAIISLNVAYKALWSSMLESEGTVLGHSQLSFTSYLPNFDPHFEEVVYPKGDADAVSISKRDFDLLQPDTFVNDTIIDFYIKYLKNKIKPEEKHRFHFFNSFFFRKLADPDKDPLNASEGRAAFQRVKKWTRKVNLFEKDYVFIPVNYNYHWSLIVICHLGDVATFQDEDVHESIKVPCVLHMDSIRGSHTGLKGLVQSYLKEEWKERQLETSEDIFSRFDNLRFISLELPQQQNSFDCGLFLLHYVELFLEQAPLHFNPFKITKSFNFLNVDWFPPAEASLKRVTIQKLICDLLENPYHEHPSAAGNERCNLSSPTNNIQKGSFLGTHFPAFNQTTAFDEYKVSPIPIEEDAQGGGQFVYSQTEPGLQQDHGIMPEDTSLPCSSQHFSNRAPWHLPVIPEHETDDNHFRSSPGTSISGCEDDALEIVDGSSQRNSQLTLEENRDQPRSPLPDILKEHVEMVDGDGEDLTSSMDISPRISSRFLDMQGTGPTGFDDSLGLEPDEQHPTKKMRMTES